jgi:8-oxo-dGTP pyrophosphatase MutT (NUDIX family)
MGAGVIPFAVNNGRLYFLFQTTFSGRKAGHLIDFGGGLGTGEDYRKTAIREFVEETETMYFSADLQRASRSAARVQKQVPIVTALFAETLSAHPEWCCRRAPGNPERPKRWQTFFIEFPYRDVERLNREWEADKVGRFKKRRELFWVTADELLAIFNDAPERLWKRVRQLENAAETIRAIQQNKEPRAQTTAHT